MLFNLIQDNDWVSNQTRHDLFMPTANCDTGNMFRGREYYSPNNGQRSRYRPCNVCSFV